MSAASFRAIGLTSPKTAPVVDADPRVEADLSTAGKGSSACQRGR